METIMQDRVENVSIKQAAEMCQVSKATIRRWIDAEMFPGATRGLGMTSPWRIPKSEVLDVIAQRLLERGSSLTVEDFLEGGNGGAGGVAPAK